MKRVIKTVVFLFLASTVLLTACQKTKSEYEQRAQESEGSSLPIAKEKEVDALLLDPRNTLDVKQKSGVISSELYVDGAKICGMVSLDKEILLADHENGQLLLMDSEGKIQERIGELGSGPLEFQKPTGITKDSQYIYVLDDGNSRVQILDYDLEYVREVKIDRTELDPSEELEDIEVDADQTIYISGCFLMNPGIIVLELKTGKESFQKINFCGFLACEQGKVYGLSSGQLYLPDEEPISFGEGTGECAVLECFPKDSRKIHKMQGINSFNDFLIKDKTMYCISQYHNELQKFDINGKYQGSIGMLDEESVLQYICEDEEGKLYVSGKSSRIFTFQE